MQRQELHSNWEMKIASWDEYIEAHVPGSVYSDMLAAGKMENPYYRDNELKALKLMENDFEYITHFDVEDAILSCDDIVLHFDGIDTLSDIYLNGNHLGSTINMHRIWEYRVRESLKKEGNELKIILHSPTDFVAKAHEKRQIEGSTDAMYGFPQLRKAHCMFGWDWGPRLPDAGIWRDVSLLGIEKARIDSVYITQVHQEKEVALKFEIEIEELVTAQLSHRITIKDPVGEVVAFQRESNHVVIEKPQLWWPNGYGEQPLYDVLVELLLENKVIDMWNKRIGLREMTMKVEKDEFGECFAHQVNGITFFAMGADYIPEDNILSRVTKDRTFDLLKQCKDANYNVIRVWGGGNYPYEGFFDACDELGLVVWEDFMFACAVYELTEDFEENITAEFIDNIKRIRHHASLGLWCGNNEMELFVLSEEYTSDPKLKCDYVKMYEYIIPKVLKQYDPNTFYWPASPSSGGCFDDPNAEDRGDVHYWEVWHGNKPITEYRKFLFRYVSEFGFQSFPSLKTIETFTEPEDRNIFSYIMEKHQRNQSANGKIMNYMGQTFLYPNDFAILLYASQLLQAEAMRYGVEHFRRNRGRCMGAVIWQLNDCWPVASWASIDYYGRWKALHYYEKRFFAPMLLSCEEEGILTQNTNVNVQPYEMQKSIRLCVSNETRKDQKVIVKWQRRNARSVILEECNYEVVSSKLSSQWLEKVDMNHASWYDDYISYAMEEDGKVVSEGTVIFCAPKHFHFIDPKLSVRVEGDEVIITSAAYARSVEVLNAEEDLLLEDNYFDMNAGEKRVKILKGEMDGLKVRSVYNIR